MTFHSVADHFTPASAASAASRIQISDLAGYLAALVLAQLALPNVIWLAFVAVAAVAASMLFLSQGLRLSWVDTREVRSFFQITRPILLACIPFLIAYALTGVNYFYASMDLFNVLAVPLTALFLFLAAPNRESFLHFEDKWSIALKAFATIAAVGGILKFIVALVLPEGGMPDQLVGLEYGSSLKKDYNNYCTFMLMAMFQEWYCLRSRGSKPGRSFAVFLVPIVFAILLSSSRRSLIFLGIAALFFAADAAWSWWRSRKGKIEASPISWQGTAVIAACSSLFLMAASPSGMEYINTTGDRLGIDTHRLTFELRRIRSRYGTLDGYAEKQAGVETPPEATTYTGRTARWIYAGEVFWNEYSLAQKAFGGGFHYLPKFAAHFQSLSKEPFPHDEDYPHNFLVSALLYSGLAGLLLLLPFLFRTLGGIVTSLRSAGAFSPMALVSLMFICISGNSLFSLRGGFLIFFLLLIRIHRFERERGTLA